MEHVIHFCACKDSHPSLHVSFSPVKKDGTFSTNFFHPLLTLQNNPPACSLFCYTINGILDKVFLL